MESGTVLAICVRRQISVLLGTAPSLTDWFDALF
jgi:hypothetical protein